MEAIFRSVLDTPLSRSMTALCVAMTIYFSSSPAKAGDPVLRDVSDGSDIPQRTGYSAFAEYDGFMRGNDDLLFVVARESGRSSTPRCQWWNREAAAYWILRWGLSSGSPAARPG